MSQSSQRRPQMVAANDWRLMTNLPDGIKSLPCFISQQSLVMG
jgi:hypothetical protein